MDQQIANITQRLVVVEKQVERLDHVINGNGQPGLASRLEKLITDLYRLKDSIERMEKLSQSKKTDWQWIVTAMIAVSAIVIQIIK